jgi:hypothetical protein
VCGAADRNKTHPIAYQGLFGSPQELIAGCRLGGFLPKKKKKKSWIILQVAVLEVSCPIVEQGLVFWV